MIENLFGIEGWNIALYQAQPPAAPKVSNLFGARTIINTPNNIRKKIRK